MDKKILLKEYIKLFGDKEPYPPDNIMKTLVDMKKSGTYEDVMNKINPHTANIKNEVVDETRKPLNLKDPFSDINFGERESGRITLKESFELFTRKILICTTEDFVQLFKEFEMEEIEFAVQEHEKHLPEFQSGFTFEYKTDDDEKCYFEIRDIDNNVLELSMMIHFKKGWFYSNIHHHFSVLERYCNNNYVFHNKKGTEDRQIFSWDAGDLMISIRKLNSKIDQLSFVVGNKNLWADILNEESENTNAVRKKGKIKKIDIIDIFRKCKGKNRVLNSPFEINNDIFFQINNKIQSNQQFLNHYEIEGLFCAIIFNPFGPTVYSMGIMRNTDEQVELFFFRSFNPFSFNNYVFAACDDSYEINLIETIDKIISGNSFKDLKLINTMPTFILPLNQEMVEITDNVIESIYFSVQEDLSSLNSMFKKTLGNPWDLAKLQHKKALKNKKDNSESSSFNPNAEDLEEYVKLVLDPKNISAHIKNLHLAWNGAIKNNVLPPIMNFDTLFNQLNYSGCGIFNIENIKNNL